MTQAERNAVIEEAVEYLQEMSKLYHRDGEHTAGTTLAKCVIGMRTALKHSGAEQWHPPQEGARVSLLDEIWAGLDAMGADVGLYNMSDEPDDKAHAIRCIGNVITELKGKVEQLRLAGRTASAGRECKKPVRGALCLREEGHRGCCNPSCPLGAAIRARSIP